MKKKNYKTLAGALAIVVFYLTAAIVFAYVILEAMAHATNTHATLFDNWWQTLLFVADVICVGGIVFCVVMLFVKRNVHEAVAASGKRNKLFNCSLWGMLSTFFAILLVIVFVGDVVAASYESLINKELGINPYKIVNNDTDDLSAAEYYKSDYYLEDGSYDHEAMRQNSLNVSERIDDESAVLLWNNDNTLPLTEGSAVSLFGIAQLAYLLGGEGSGHVAAAPSIRFRNALEDVGFKVNAKLVQAYTMVQSGKGMRIKSSPDGDPNCSEFLVNDLDWAEINSSRMGNIESTLASYGDAAIMTVARNGAENGDTFFQTDECLDKCYLDLSVDEADVLQHLKDLKAAGKIKKIVLLLNSATPMQMKNIVNYDIDACVWVGMGGNPSFKSIANILSGKANPSGKLVDIYANDIDSAPANENIRGYIFSEYSNKLPAQAQYSYNKHYIVYQEGIYVGYRYYETRYEDSVLGTGNADSTAGVQTSADGWKYTQEVAFPFGFGGSYTSFEYSGYSVTKSGDDYKVNLTIKNTGGVAGKDVMQVYLQKPYTQYDKTNKMEKASVELAAYAKTKLLAPGESQQLTVTVEGSQLACYDAYGKGTYILEKGNYYIAVGTDSHNALNNILAKKGYSSSDGMDYDGNDKLAHEVRIDRDDFTKYSVSETTGNKIVNQFSDADLNLYEHTQDQRITYLSRSDWKSTYPSTVILKCIDEGMVEDMQYVHAVPDSDEEMPTTGTVTFEGGKLTIAMLMELAYDDPKWEDLLNQLTVEEMSMLCTYGGGSIAGLESIAMPLSRAKDGPCGISIANPVLRSMMAFPSAVNQAATWNDDLVEELGNAFGLEILHVGYTEIYGPGTNTHRSPYSGRNWEYFSEDGFIAGKMFAAETRGLSKRGIITCAKHFALNDQEKYRCGVTTWANEQTIREIYLRSFEIGVKEGKCNGMMSSLNRIGTTWAGKHCGLLTEVLRNEWGYIGIVETDAAVGVHMTAPNIYAEGVVAGNDLWMGGGSDGVFNAYKNNAKVINAARESAHRLIYTVLHSNAMNGVTSSTRIVKVATWWEQALDIGKIVSVVAFSLTASMLVASIVITILSNKKNKLTGENYEKD